MYKNSGFYTFNKHHNNPPKPQGVTHKPRKINTRNQMTSGNMYYVT